MIYSLGRKPQSEIAFNATATKRNTARHALTFALLLSFALRTSAADKHHLEAAENVDFTAYVGAVELQVFAKEARWQSSGVSLRNGQRYHLSAGGTWRIGKGCNVTAADGVGVDTDPCPEMLMRPVGQFTASALIAKIGENGRPMGIGNATTLMAPADGVLYFRINDPMTWDNEGQITVRVALDTRQVIPAEAGQNREGGGGQGGGAGGRRNLR